MDRADIDVILEARKILWRKDEKLSTQEDFTKLWKAVNAEIREKLLQGKASQLINVGTFSVSKWRHGGKVVQSSPVFALSGRLLRKFGVRERKQWGPAAAPRLLTAASASGACAHGLRGAAACLAALQAALRACVATGYASLVFPGLGTLLVARGVARMTFEKDFLDEFRRRERESRRRQRRLVRPAPPPSPPPPPPPPQQPPQKKTSPPPSPPPLPAKRPRLHVSPPSPSQSAKPAYTPQRQLSPIGHPQSTGESSPQRSETRAIGTPSEQQKQLRPNASTRGTAGARTTCNLTSCSRHSRHASTQEPRSLLQLPDMKRRREEMEIAEFYRRREQEKVDKEGVLRLYEMDCEMSLAKLVRDEATKERRRRMRLLRAARAKGDALSTSRYHVNKAVEQGSAEAGVALTSTGYLSTSLCPC